MQMLRFTQHDNSMSVILNNVKDLAPYPRTGGEYLWCSRRERKDVEKKKSGRGYTKWLHVSPGGSGPEMMIRHWGPDTDIPVHSHPYHEMFYVLEGEIEIGGTIYSAGSCIYVEKNTPYGPTRAPKGGKVLRYAEAGIGK